MSYLIWLAAAWSIVALALTGAVLTTAFRDSGIRRLESVLEATDVEVLAVTRVEEEMPQRRSAILLRHGEEPRCLLAIQVTSRPLLLEILGCDFVL